MNRANPYCWGRFHDARLDAAVDVHVAPIALLAAIDLL
jgi:hypothetical protein